MNQSSFGRFPPADLMIEHNIGVSTVRTIELKRLDLDYLEE
jgi:restriction system protein